MCKHTGELATCESIQYVNLTDWRIQKPSILKPVSSEVSAFLSLPLTGSTSKNLNLEAGFAVCQTGKALIYSNLLDPASSCFFTLSLFVALPLISPPQIRLSQHVHSVIILATKCITWEMLCTIVSQLRDRFWYFCLFGLKTGWPTRALPSIKYLLYAQRRKEHFDTSLWYSVYSGAKTTTCILAVPLSSFAEDAWGEDVTSVFPHINSQQTSSHMSKTHLSNVNQLCHFQQLTAFSVQNEDTV